MARLLGPRLVQTSVSPARHDRAISYEVGLPRLEAHPAQINRVNVTASGILSDARGILLLANRPAYAGVVFGFRTADPTSAPGTNQGFSDTTVIRRLIHAGASGA